MKKLGWHERFKKSLKQPSDSVIYRTSDGVWYHKLGRNVLQQPAYRNFEYLQYYAKLSARIYDTNSDIAAPAGFYLLEDDSDLQDVDAKGVVVKGLKYQVWHWPAERQLIIAFRGSGKRLGDWFANFRWATRFIPGVHDHYDVVRENIDKIIKRCQHQVPVGTSIIATGHSLGGGLAQQAAYGSTEISTVYAFNPTPVTGYRNVNEAALNENRKGVFIARVFEHGEMLAYLRFGLRKFYKISAANPQIVEVRFNFTRSVGVVKEHAMEEFAQHVWDATAVTRTRAV